MVLINHTNPVGGMSRMRSPRLSGEGGGLLYRSSFSLASDKRRDMVLCVDSRS